MSQPSLLKQLSVAVAVLVLGLCVSAVGAQPLPDFTDVALEVGFQDRLNHGRALVADDFNGDGWVDFYLGNPGDADFPDDSFILWNDGPDGEGNFSFTKGQVLVKGDIAFTASAPDFDNDGDPDLFIGIGGQEGIGLDYMFRNDDGFFVDISTETGLRGPHDTDGTPVPVATSSGTWADYDNDGDLDLYTAVRINLRSLDVPLGGRSSMFRNNNDGTFTEVTEEVGIMLEASEKTASWGDFDDDGWMDLYVPQIKPQGFALYRNKTDGTFQRVPIDPESVDFGKRATWASSVADLDLDGRLDIISWGHRGGDADSHALLMNQGDWVFVNEAGSSGLVRPGAQVPATMGTVVGDFNNDGYVELYMGNGGPGFGEEDSLFLNATAVTGSLSFVDVSEMIDFAAAVDPDCVAPEWPISGLAPKWFDHEAMAEGHAGDGRSVDSAGLELGEIDPCDPPYPYRGHGTVMVDFDKDGDLDLIAIKGGTAIVAPQIWSGEPNRLYRNDGQGLGNWLFVSLEGSLSNRDAFGARIEVDSSRGGSDHRTMAQQVQGNTGFSSEHPRELHFGLGDHDQIDEIRVAWPSGVRTVLPAQAVNQRIFVDEVLTQASDFNDGSFQPWFVVQGDWSVVDNAFLQTSNSTAMAVANLDMTDFTLVGKVTAGSAGGRIGLTGRMSTDGRSFYAAILTGGQAQVFRALDGVMTPLGEPLMISPLAAGKSYIVSLGFEGSQIHLEVNRLRAEPVEDSALTNGRVGLVTVGTAAAFDNVAVY